MYYQKPMPSTCMQTSLHTHSLPKVYDQIPIQMGDLCTPCMQDDYQFTIRSKKYLPYNLNLSNNTVLPRNNDVLSKTYAPNMYANTSLHPLATKSL